MNRFATITTLAAVAFCGVAGVIFILSALVHTAAFALGVMFH